MNATVSAAHSGQPRSGTPTPAAERNPWITLWVMIIGFFMMLLDTTIVAVANPCIQEGLGVDVGAVIWVVLFVYSGYFFGNLPFIKRNFSAVILAIIVISVLPGVIEYLRHKKAAAAAGK